MFDVGELLEVVKISPFCLMCGLTGVSIAGCGGRGRGSSSSRMKGVQVKPCLSLRLVRFFLSCIRSLGPVRGVAGREGREPLLSVSVSSSLRRSDIR